MKRGLDYLDEKLSARNNRAEYLRRIDVEAVLEHYEAANMYRMGDEIVHSCLLDKVDPHHSNGDQNPSALANVESKLYLCRTYSAWPGGDILSFIMRMEGAEELYEVVPIISKLLGDQVLEKEDLKAQLKKRFNPAKEISEPVPRLSDRALSGWAKYHPWLETRGISFEAASRLGIGYDSKDVRITFPHWIPGGTLVGWQKRKLDDPRWPKTPPQPVFEDGKIVSYVDPPPKYKNSTGFPKHSTLYNLQRVLERGITEVIVVESPMSVAMAETLMLDSDDRLAGVVATFGAQMPEEQVALLRQFTKVSVYMDDDPAGRGSSFKLLEGLYRHTNVWYIQAQDGMDMGDYRDRESLMRVIDGNVKPAFQMLATLNREKREQDARVKQQRDTAREQVRRNSLRPVSRGGPKPVA